MNKKMTKLGLMLLCCMHGTSRSCAAVAGYHYSDAPEYHGTYMTSESGSRTPHLSPQEAQYVLGSHMIGVVEQILSRVADFQRFMLSMHQQLQNIARHEEKTQLQNALRLSMESARKEENVRNARLQEEADLETALRLSMEEADLEQAIRLQEEADLEAALRLSRVSSRSRTRRQSEIQARPTVQSNPFSIPARRTQFEPVQSNHFTGRNNFDGMVSGLSSRNFKLGRESNTMHKLLLNVRGVVVTTGLFSYDEGEDVMSTIGAIDEGMSPAAAQSAIEQIKKGTDSMLLKKNLEKILTYNEPVSVEQRNEIAFLTQRLNDTSKALEFCEQVARRFPFEPR